MAAVEYLVQNSEWIADGVVFPPNIADAFIPLLVLGCTIEGTRPSGRVAGRVQGFYFDSGGNLLIVIA